MALTQKNDFIELEFVARAKDSDEVFDTNVKSEIEKKKLEFEPKPFIVAIGRDMAIRGLDRDLEGKEIGKDYSVEIKPEDAFGKRNPSMVKMIPLKVFVEQKIMPQRGMQLSLDGMVVKIVSVSGGRVLVDFNNPLAGKNVIYNYKITRKIDDDKEKINALQDFFFRKKFDFEIKGNEVVFKVEKAISKFVDAMKKPIEEISGMKVLVEEIEKKIEKEGGEEKK